MRNKADIRNITGITISNKNDQFVVHTYEIEDDFHYSSEHRTFILELLARVKAFLRRVDTEAIPAQAPQTPDVVDFADIHLDFKKYEATKGGCPLEMSAREFQILKYFWQHKGEVVLREDLLQDIWGYTTENMPSTRTIDNHIVNLRKKLEDDQANPKIILSIRGAGYKFDV